MTRPSEGATARRRSRSVAGPTTRRARRPHLQEPSGHTLSADPGHRRLCVLSLKAARLREGLVGRSLLAEKARGFQIVVFTCRPADYLTSAAMVGEDGAVYFDSEEGFVRAIDLRRLGRA